MEGSAKEVGVEGHGFGKGVVAVAGDEQVVFLAAELRIAAWDHPGVDEYLECRGSAVAKERHIAPLVCAHDIGHVDTPGVQAAPHQAQRLNGRQLANGLGTAKAIAHDYVVATMAHARHTQIRASLGGNHPQAIAHRVLQFIQIEPAARQACYLSVILDNVHAQALVRHQRKFGIGKPAAT